MGDEHVSRHGGEGFGADGYLIGQREVQVRRGIAMPCRKIICCIEMNDFYITALFIKMVLNEKNRGFSNSKSPLSISLRAWNL